MPRQRKRWTATDLQASKPKRKTKQPTPRRSPKPRLVVGINYDTCKVKQ